MLEVYIDESGIGRRVGVSVYCVVFCAKKDVSTIDERILEAEKELEIPPFHWREHSWRVKAKFLQRILRVREWTCLVVIVDNKEYSYQRFEELLAKALQGLDISKIYIDGKKSKNYTYAVKKSLKDLGIKVSTLKMVKHQTKGGLRIADAIAGLTRLNFDKKAKKEAKDLFQKFLRKKITTQILSGYLA